ncbi:hypothetical protein [Haloarchaeobius sp. DFWS5]|uniref:hypothetical protein n=1 Tax=Haloarchaeobius sp. DFWS5 TaxID=3446114 RepID=UPI003EBFC3B8
MTGSSRVSRSRLVLLLALLVAVAMVSFDSGSTANSDEYKSPDDVKLVTVHEDGQNALWPYTSRSQRFETLTLPLNVLVHEDPDLVQAMLTRQLPDATVDEASNESVLPALDGAAWDATHGATRYTYVRQLDDGTGTWAEEYSQLHVGSYLGSRQHVRLYEVPTDGAGATAIQAHNEHWDWFRLRHTVGSTAAGQVYVEQQFYGVPTVERVSRERFANGGILDSDGWVTVVDVRDGSVPPIGVDATGNQQSVVATDQPAGVRDGPAQSTDSHGAWSLFVLTGATLGLGMATDELDELQTGLGDLQQEATDALEQFRAEWSVTRNHVFLFGTLAVFPLAVRAGSVTVETWQLVENPKYIAAVFYPLLVLGIPICAYHFAAGLGFAESALVAALGLLTGVVLDYGHMGIAVIPRYVIVQRLALVVALTAVAAAGSVRHERHWRANELLAAGVVCWTAAVVWPLLDFL